MTDTCKDETEIDLTVPEEHKENGLAHVSKSRIKVHLQCPRKFYAKYWADNRPPGSYHTEKGSQIHRVYEEFHENLIDFADENGHRPLRFASLMPDWKDYSQWLEPHIRNFWEFEEKRWELANEYAHGDERNLDREKYASQTEYAMDLWLPVGVEEEGRLEDPPAGDLPWMGYADAVLHAASIPQVDSTEGVVILDYKTGSVEDEKYRDEGIYLEGEYYGWLFEEDDDFEHEIVAVAGYYPQEDELVVSPYPDQDRRETIMEAVEGMQEEPTLENYPFDEQPLCHYGKGRCFFYNVCPSTWGLSGGSGYHAKAENDNSVSISSKPTGDA